MRKESSLPYDIKSNQCKQEMYEEITCLVVSDIFKLNN